jgi:hypothetical protein
MGNDIVLLSDAFTTKDNLGNHIAEKSLNMANYNINNLNYASGTTGIFKDNVGINEDAPTEKLEVRGNIKIKQGNISIAQTGIIESPNVGGHEAHIFVDEVNDDLVIRKSNRSERAIIVDGDAGNVGIKWVSGITPSFDLDISGSAGLRTVSSISKSKGQLDHDSKGTNLRLYNKDGSAKSKLVASGVSWMKGGGLAVGTGASASTPYDFEVGGEANIKGPVSVNGSGYFKNDIYVDKNIQPITSGHNSLVGSTLGTSTKYFYEGFINKGWIDTGYFQDKVVLSNPEVPTGAVSAGQEGQISWDSDYIYICVANGSWKRSAISTW